MKFRFLLVVILILAVQALVSAQKLPASLAQMLGATSLSFPRPIPQTLFEDPANDLWPLPEQTQTPQTPPPPNAPGVPQPRARTPMDLRSIQGKSNGQETVLNLLFSDKTDMKKVQGELVGNIYLDTDQNPQTGYKVRWTSGNMAFRPDIGYEVDISLWNFRYNGTADIVVNDNLDQRVVIKITGQVLSLVIPNEIIGEFGDGEMDLALAIGDTEAPIDVAPNTGHGSLSSIIKLSISPDSSTFLTTQSFDIGLAVERDSPQISFRKAVFYDGQDMTVAFEASEVPGEFAPLGYLTPRGWINTRGGKSSRYRVPAGSMTQGLHTVGVIILAPDGIAAKQVEFVVLPATDSGR